jgi:hypothetical protein
MEYQMPRIRLVNGVEEFYTVEEDAAQDKIDAEWEAGAEARNAVNEREVELEAKLSDDSITFEEMKELMRLRG